MREPSRRVLLCCETGHGSGHVTTLATVARALGPGYPCQAIIPEMDRADVLSPVCARVDRGAVLARLPGRPAAGAFNWAVWLDNRGYGEPEVLKAQFDWWALALQTIKPALVVADYAPTALLAARALGIPTVAVGAAFGSPPATLPCFPELLSRDQAALLAPVSGEPAPSEDAICACVNATLGPLGVPPLARLPEVYAADLSLPHGVSIWDPYDGARNLPLVLPFDSMPPLSGGSGEEIFIYFSGLELTEPAIQDALCRLPFKACLVAPGLTPDMARRLQENPCLSIAPAPLPREEIVRRSRMVLCAGQAGTLALAVLAGLPVVALPMHHEQLSNALRAAEGLTSVRMVPKKKRSAETILDIISELWERSAIAAAAKLAAMDLRDGYDGAAQHAYRKAILAMMRDKGGGGARL
ncbi:glycosyltransferase [Aestuariivita boseongensis]|uniref:glycosyltransferase n=1 Tax=Aestuariivita boseongensis TaxID=1470562 RepID=UPI00068238DD|nr:hypothetical protein [Aestuariivita boseongensis]